MIAQNHRILVAAPFTDSQSQLLHKAAPQAHFSAIPSDDVTADELIETDILIGNIDPRQLKHAPHLAWVQLASAGSNRYDQPGVLPEGALLTTAVGAYGQAVSEHLFAMTWSLVKNLPAYHDFQNRRQWKDAGPATSLAGARIVVIGLGDIGRHYARLAASVGGHVTGVKRTAIAPPEGVDHIVTNDALFSVLPTADIVVSFVPLTDQTRGLCNADFFAAMKPSAYFLNGGRGATVDTEALIGALTSRHLRGAGLDVTDPEPLPTDSPLWEMSNVIITPHVAGGFHLPGVLDAASEIAADNLRRFLAGEPLRNRVQTA